jgi:hypothetical protein
MLSKHTKHTVFETKSNGKGHQGRNQEGSSYTYSFATKQALVEQMRPGSGAEDASAEFVGFKKPAGTLMCQNHDAPNILSQFM